MVLVFRFTGGVDSRDTGGLILVVYPNSAHGVMHARKNHHRFFAWIDTAEFFVDFEDAFEFAVENFARNVRDVQKNGGLAVNSELLLINDAVNGTRGDIARN